MAVLMALVAASFAASALARPRATVFGADVYPSLDEKAAALLASLVANRALDGGNERLGWVAVRVFHRLNDHDLHAPHDEAFALVMSLADGDGLEQGVATLEAQVRELTDRVGRSEHDATAARVLAGGADRDVGQIRAEIRDFREQDNRALHTMREDLTDLRGDFTDLRSQVTGLRNRVDAGFAQVRGALDAAAAGRGRIVELLDRALGPDA